MTPRRLFLAAALCVAGAIVTAAPATAGGGCHQPRTEGVTRGQGDMVQLAVNCFTPNVLDVERGTTVTFVNSDSIDHNVTATTWASGLIPAAGTFSHRFDEAGIFPFSCTLHPGMTGAVAVADDMAASAAPPASLPVSTRSSDDEEQPTGASGVVTMVAVGAALVGGFIGGRTVGRRR